MNEGRATVVIDADAAASGPQPPPFRDRHGAALPEPRLRRPAGMPQSPVTGVGAWLLAWGELALLGLLAIVGAFFAAEAAAPGDYGCGMILIVASIALAFVRLKARFDGAPADWGGFLLVDDWANFTAITVVFAVVGLAGVFVSASYDRGGLHNAGIALFIVSALAVFLNLKHVFDIRDRRR